MGSKRRRVSVDPLETANAKTDQIFIEEYLTTTAPGAQPWMTAWTHPRTGEKHSLTLRRAEDLDERDLKACFDLIAETSKGDYEASAGGWHPDKKLAEMKSPGLRYILVKSEQGSLAGFTSLMPTYEAGQPVVYCYEIHLKPHLQGTGLGRMLMGFLFTVATNIPPIQKVMLTCFLSNKRAHDFYHKLGFGKDGISPPSRELRGGKMFTPDYEIMSKEVVRPTVPEVQEEQPSRRDGDADAEDPGRDALPRKMLRSSPRQGELRTSKEASGCSDLPAGATPGDGAGDSEPTETPDK